MPTERLYRGAVAKIWSSLPGSFQCLIVVYLLCAIYNEQKNMVCGTLNQAVTLPKPSQVCIYDKSRSSHSRCCGSAGWLVLCAVTLSPCTSVELISLSLQLMITCSMRQYDILQSAVSSLASFQRAQSPLEPPCALWYTEHPFMCATATFCYLSHSILTTPSVSVNYALAR